MKTEKMYFRKPKWLRRIASAFLDIFSAVILALLISFISTPIVNKVFNGPQAYEELYSYSISTRIYTYNEDGTLSVISDVKTMDENITYFYENCTEGKIDEYNNLKKEKSDLFVLDTETGNYVEKEYDYNNQEVRAQYTVFYQGVLEICKTQYLDAYLMKQEGYKEALTKVNQMLYTNILVCSFLGLALIYLVVPLLNKDFKTFGKMAFKLRIISKVGPSSKPSKLQLIFRQLFTIFFEYVLTVATLGIFGIPIPFILLISMSMVFLTKHNQSFHDLCTSTMLVDDYPSNEAVGANNSYMITYFKEEK